MKLNALICLICLLFCLSVPGADFDGLTLLESAQPNTQQAAQWSVMAAGSATRESIGIRDP